VNWRAMAAWIPATILGLLTANTPMIAGPLKDIAGGVDISMVVTLCTAAVAYPLLVKLFPEPREVYAPVAAEPAPAPAVALGQEA
jgi:purine-cytosine permease-like protein